MRKILRLARRDFLAAVCTKGFVIGLVLAPLLMGGGFIGVALLEKRGDTTDKRVAIVDRTGRLGAGLRVAAEGRNQREVIDAKTGRKARPAYLLELVEPDPNQVEAQRLALSDRVRRGELHAFLDIGCDVIQGRTNSATSQVEYYARSPALDDVRRWIAWPLNEQLRQARLRDAGIDPARIGHVFDWVEVGGMGLVSQDAQTGATTPGQRRGEAEAVGVPMATVMIAMLLIMMGSAPLLQGVMEEKSQRIAEVLLGSVTPFEFMMGKVLGGLAIALTGSVVYVVAGMATLSSLALVQLLPLSLIFWFFAFVSGAILMYGAILAALGSACSDAKDAQSLQLPAMLPMLIPMFLMVPVLKEPQSALATWLSLCPPFTPLTMLLRLSTPEGVPTWQPWVGLLGVILGTLLAVWAGGRIFRVGILMQGKAPRLTTILKWTWSG